MIGDASDTRSQTGEESTPRGREEWRGVQGAVVYRGGGEGGMEAHRAAKKEKTSEKSIGKGDSHALLS